VLYGTSFVTRLICAAVLHDDLALVTRTGVVAEVSRFEHGDIFQRHVALAVELDAAKKPPVSQLGL
jgi:hypothetical protein